MRLETRTLYSWLRPHNGLGAPRARPPERSGDRGAPRATAKGGPRGRSPPDLVRPTGPPKVQQDGKVFPINAGCKDQSGITKCKSGPVLALVSGLHRCTVLFSPVVRLLLVVGGDLD